ncbi:helix-turn-helix transcriptional regulator [Lysobacter koreensis]|uniref:Helix-turn-helix transcriptional regulator n=1 Tax=Lysobacter koreensis TaxID=266122 RepID=A0ABW2YQW4_9GAMM
MSGLRQFGSTQKKLMRELLQAPQGATVETLCAALRITHNAVRQHLTALIGAGAVTHGTARASGGRPQARYLLTPSGRDLFPRNYDLIAAKVLERLYANLGPAQVRTMLLEMGRELGAAAAGVSSAQDDDVASALAAQLDALGYEAQTARHDGELQVEAFNCVFHSLAQAHPEVCQFDLAFMEAASGRPIEHLECLVRGGRACRFRIGSPPGKDGDPPAGA